MSQPVVTKACLDILSHRFTFATGASWLVFIVHFPLIYAVCPRWSAKPVKPRWSSNDHIDHGNPWWDGPTLRANERTLYAPLPNQKSISLAPFAPNQSKVHLSHSKETLWEEYILHIGDLRCLITLAQPLTKVASFKKVSHVCHRLVGKCSFLILPRYAKVIAPSASASEITPCRKKSSAHSSIKIS